MRYILKHKNVDVAVLDIHDKTGYIEEVMSELLVIHAPVGTTGKNNKIDIEKIRDWWIKRAIPNSRENLKETLDAVKAHSPSALETMSYGLSLSDHYWICPEDKDIAWESVNYFDNEFSKDVGELLFGNSVEDKKNIKVMSPNTTLDGELKKKWVITNGERCLIKGSRPVNRQEPYNEVIASKMLDMMGIEHVHYDMFIEGDQPYSICKNIINKDTEIVPMWRFIHDIYAENMQNSDVNFAGMIKKCNEEFIPNAEEMLSKMLMFDYIISNSDRHYNNFGLIRNSGTLEWKGFVPIFDNGNSLWSNRPNSLIGTENFSKPFYELHDHQIKLVKNHYNIAVENISGIKDFVVDLFSKYELFKEQRDRAILISEEIEKRIEQVIEYKAEIG